MVRSLVGLAEKNDVSHMQMLLEEGQNINQFESNRSALHAACVTNAIDAVKFLISRGIDVNMQDHFTAATALHYCAIYNFLDIAKMILENGGRLEISDDYGNQPLWTAVFNVKGKVDRLPLIELFLAYGADKYNKNKAGRSPLDFARQVKSISLELLNR